MTLNSSHIGLGFFYEIQRHYGVEMRSSFRQYRIQLRKLATTKAREVFLLKCRRHEIYPRFILDKTNSFFKRITNKPNISLNNIHSQLNKILLNTEIDACISQKRKMEISINQLKNTIAICQPHSIMFIENADQFHKRLLQEQNQILFAKLTELLRTQNHLNDIPFEPSFIENISTVQIPYDMSLLLSLGPKFAMQPEKLPVPDIICDLEHIVSRFAHPNISDPMRSQLVYTPSLNIWRHTNQPTVFNVFYKKLQWPLSVS